MAKRIILLSVIILFWFLLSFTLGLMADDTLLTPSYVQGNASYSVTVDSSSFNATDTEALDSVTNIGTGFGAAVKFLFGAKIAGFSDLPNGIIIFLRFLNYILLMVTIMLIYKILNPFAA